MAKAIATDDPTFTERPFDSDITPVVMQAKIDAADVEAARLAGYVLVIEGVSDRAVPRAGEPTLVCDMPFQVMVAAADGYVGTCAREDAITTAQGLADDEQRISFYLLNPADDHVLLRFKPTRRRRLR
jgi:hypothetical protein